MAEQAKAKFWLGRQGNLRCITDAVGASQCEVPFADALEQLAEGCRLDSMRLRDAAVALAAWAKRASRWPQEEEDAGFALRLAVLFASVARKNVRDTFRLYSDCDDKDPAAGFDEAERAGPDLSNLLQVRDTIGVCPICL